MIEYHSGTPSRRPLRTRPRVQKFINSFYSCGVYILLQMFKYLAVITTAASLQPIRKQYFQNFRNSHKEKEE